jgi:hypothetical protein
MQYTFTVTVCGYPAVKKRKYYLFYLTGPILPHKKVQTGYMQ